MEMNLFYYQNTKAIKKKYDVYTLNVVKYQKKMQEHYQKMEDANIVKRVKEKKL